MLLLMLAPSLALAAPTWEGDDPDVSATAEMAAEPQVIYDWLLDLSNYASLLPEDCVSGWTPGPSTRGSGATGSIVFDLGFVHPQVEAVYLNLSEPRNIDIDHAGPRGFISRFLIEPTTTGSRVEFRTFIDPPGWPFKKAYWTRVRPRWTGCQEQALVRLEAAVTAKP